MHPATRILIVDDQPLLRLGLAGLLEQAGGFVVAAEAASGAEALRLLAHTAVDLVVLDIALPGRSGIEILKRMRRDSARLPVLAYSRLPEEHYAVRVLRAGANGYLMKSAPPDELLQALRQLAAGERYVSPRIAPLLAAAPARTRAHDALSNREIEVLRMLASGYSVSRVAGELSLSIKTVSTHRTRILGKLALSSTADLVHYALTHGLYDAA